MPDFDPAENEFLKAIGPLPSCPPLAMLQAHGQSVLPEEAEAAVSRHLATCALCRMLLEDLASSTEPELTATDMERIRRRIPVSRNNASRLNWYGWGPIAACLLLAVSLFIVFRGPGPTQPQTSSGSRAAPESSVNFSLQVAKLDPPGPEQTLLLRGTASASEPTVADLQPAFDAYNANNYSLAVTRFEKLTAKFPRSSIPVLYLGVSQLLAGDDSRAFATLAEAESLTTGSEKAAALWYRAVAAVRLRSPDTRDILRAVCHSGSSYAAQACAALAPVEKK